MFSVGFELETCLDANGSDNESLLKVRIHCLYRVSHVTCPLSKTTRNTYKIKKGTFRIFLFVKNLTKGDAVLCQSLKLCYSSLTTYLQVLVLPLKQVLFAVHLIPLVNSTLSES